MYISAGLVGSLLSIIHNVMNHAVSNDDSSFVVSAGASGAIMGLGGALIVAAWRPKENLHPAQALQLRPLLLIMAINFALGFSIAGIDNAAHFGGIITGGLLGLIFSLTEKMNLRQRQIVRISTFIMLAIIGWAIFHQLQLAESDLQPRRAGILAQLSPLDCTDWESILDDEIHIQHIITLYCAHHRWLIGVKYFGIMRFSDTIVSISR